MLKVKVVFVVDIWEDYKDKVYFSKRCIQRREYKGERSL